MRRLLLTLGTISAIALPTISVIACGTTANETFTEASVVQKVILNNLGTKLETLFHGTDAVPKIDVNQAVFRFTFNVSDQADDTETYDEPESSSTTSTRIRISVDFRRRSIVKIEKALPGEDFEIANYSLPNTTAEVEEEIEAAVKGTTPEGEGIFVHNRDVLININGDANRELKGHNDILGNK